MELPDSPLAAWRRRLDDAHQRYRMASARYRELMEKAPEGQIRDQDDPLAIARHAESEALAEYVRLRKIVTELMGRPGKSEAQPKVRTSGGGM